MNGTVKFIEKHWKVIIFIMSIIITWTTLIYKVENTEIKLKKVEAQQEKCSQDNNEIRERLIRLETKIDLLLNDN